jgi:hypothetical protein
MYKIYRLILLSSLLLLGLSAPVFVEMKQPGKTSSGVEHYSEASQIGTITDRSLAEISGMTPARTAKGLWWVHNDSGGKPQIYLINSTGKFAGQFVVTGAKNRDWEDIASGPGRGGAPSLYIADIGDNSRKFEGYTIYRVKEPNLAKGRLNGATEPAELLRFRYPDGKHDAEALFIDPQNGRPYIVTKKMTPPCGVYRFPLPLRPTETVTLEKVPGHAIDRISNLMMVTGAAASPDGTRVIVRSYFTAVEITKNPSGPFETIFNNTPQIIKIPFERQGEAISYTPDSKSIVTTSERLPAPIFHMVRLP